MYFCSKAFAFPPWAASCFNEIETKGAFSPLTFVLLPHESTNKSFKPSKVLTLSRSAPPKSTNRSPGLCLSEGYPDSCCPNDFAWVNNPSLISFSPGYASLIAKAYERGWLINLIYLVLLLSVDFK